MENCPTCAFDHGEMVPKHTREHGKSQNDHLREAVQYDGAGWETVDMRPFFRGAKCSECENPAHHIAIAEDEGADGDVVLLRARCENHFNRLTAKTWLKRWKRNHIKP